MDAMAREIVAMPGRSGVARCLHAWAENITSDLLGVGRDFRDRWIFCVCGADVIFVNNAPRAAWVVALGARCWSLVR